MTIKIALKTLASDRIWVVAERAVGDTVRSVPLLLLEDDDVCHVERSIAWAVRIAFTFSQEWKVVLAHNTISVFSAVTESAAFMTSYITDLNIFVPLRSHMSEHSILVLNSSH